MCGSARVCVHIHARVCAYTPLCVLSGMDTLVKSGAGAQMTVCSGPPYLVSVPASFFLFLLSENKIKFHLSRCAWSTADIGPQRQCLLAVLKFCLFLGILSYFLSFFFSEPVTCHICCPAAPLLLVLLPSLALLPPHSSSCPTSDLIWPHVDLWASSSLVILFSRAPPSFSRVGTLSSSLKQLCVCTTVCACACCMLCCSNICVCLCMCARVCVCVFQTYLFKVSQVKITSYSRAWNLFILFLVFFQDYRE